MQEIQKKLSISLRAIYVRISEIQKKCLCSREDAANILAAEVGVPIYNFLSEAELQRVRELQKSKTVVQKIQHNKTKENEKTITKEEKITDNKLYDLMELHPKIVEVTRSQFKSGHYSEAIFNAFRCIEIRVKKKSGLKKRGWSLMQDAFNENHPRIKINSMQNDYEIDEQAGFKHIYAGAMLGIRNPKAHADIKQKDSHRTLEYLSLASLLVKRVEEGEKVNE